MTIKARLSSICAVTVMVLAVAACGGSTTPTGGAPAASAPATDNASPSTSSSSADPAVRKVSANTASEGEIEAALRSAGVSNPERWSEEVVEYRPYPADDPNLTKLRENLAKYNPGQATVDKIVSALTP